MTQCECAHICHFDYKVKTPDGCLGHTAGEAIPNQHIVEIKIDGRIAKVCGNCAGDCLKGKHQ